ncbi:MAG: flagellar motor stator protein MotA [Alphaproteobacteria bacterium]|nr:flagellar motor stator protein MotA [Alphaproteobacteria bacterium]
MLFIVGLLIVISSVLGGYVMHHGELKVLNQPSEFLIILGSGLGAMVIGNPLSVLKETLYSLKYLFRSKHKSKAEYLELLSLVFNIFKFIKAKGMLAIESHIENPKESDLFSQAPSFLKDHHALEFFRDYLRLLTMGVDTHQLESLLDRDLEIYEHECSTGSRVFAGLGDALPALGIVAAVLGVIVTMGSISEPPTVLGKLIGAALVGTFTGVLVAYGLVAPIASYLKDYSEQQVMFATCLKAGILSHANGNAPIISIEFIRKNIPHTTRPDFYELDQFINKPKGE